MKDMNGYQSELYKNTGNEEKTDISKPHSTNPMSLFF